MRPFLLFSHFRQPSVTEILLQYHSAPALFTLTHKIILTYSSKEKKRFLIKTIRGERTILLLCTLYFPPSNDTTHILIDVGILFIL